MSSKRARGPCWSCPLCSSSKYCAWRVTESLAEQLNSCTDALGAIILSREAWFLPVIRNVFDLSDMVCMAAPELSLPGNKTLGRVRRKEESRCWRWMLSVAVKVPGFERDHRGKSYWELSKLLSHILNLVGKYL